MEKTFTVVKYEEKIGTVIRVKYFENKKFSLAKIMTVAKENNFDVTVITGEIILVKTVSDFYADGRKKYRYWTFFTQEAWDDILAEEAEEA